MADQTTDDPADQTAPALDDVRALVQERERFEAWLTALEGRREATPEKVFQRVHADYAARRDAVLLGLASHVAPLERWAATLAARHAALAVERDAHAETRAEAEIRHAVGEYTDSQWHDVRATVDAALADLDVADEILRHDRDDVEHLLGMARRGNPASPLPVLPDLAPEPAAAATIPVIADTRVQEDAAVAEAPSPATDGHLVPQDTEAPAPPVAAVPAEAVEGPTAQEHALPAVPSVEAPVVTADPTPVEVQAIFAVGVDAPPAVVEEPLPLRDAADDEIETAWQESAARGFTVGEARPGRVTQEVAALETFEVYTGPNPAVEPPAPPTDGRFDDLAFLRSLTVNSEATKTLRCTECGTMNFPTEWYCERCGGELAAL
jgi:hypothetical protein